MHVFERVWKMKREVLTHGGEFRISPVYGVAGQSRCVAKILQPEFAIGTVTVDSAHPPDAHARSKREIRSSSVDYFPNNLMPGDHFCKARGKSAFHNLQIRPADAAGVYTHQQVPRPQLRPRYILHV